MVVLASATTILATNFNINDDYQYLNEYLPKTEFINKISNCVNSLDLTKNQCKCLLPFITLDRFFFFTCLKRVSERSQLWWWNTFPISCMLKDRRVDRNSFQTKYYAADFLFVSFVLFSVKAKQFNTHQNAIVWNSVIKKKYL